MLMQSLVNYFINYQFVALKISVFLNHTGDEKKVQLKSKAKA